MKSKKIKLLNREYQVKNRKDWFVACGLIGFAFVAEMVAVYCFLKGAIDTDYWYGFYAVLFNWIGFIVVNIAQNQLEINHIAKVHPLSKMQDWFGQNLYGFTFTILIFIQFLFNFFAWVNP